RPDQRLANPLHQQPSRPVYRFLFFFFGRAASFVLGFGFGAFSSVMREVDGIGCRTVIGAPTGVETWGTVCGRLGSADQLAVVLRSAGLAASYSFTRAAAGLTSTLKREASGVPGA